MPPKVVTIVNQKGGTGKTTLTALLGHALAFRNYKVLLIDLDPQSHLSSFFIKLNELEKVRGGFVELVRGDKFRIWKVKIGSKSELGIIPSGLNYIIDVYRGSIPSWEPHSLYVRLAREPVINKYDFVLCDSPPDLFPPTIWGLYAADYIIIPTNLEELSLLGVKLLIKEILSDVIALSKKELKVLGIVLVNITRKWKSETINKMSESIKKFIGTLPWAIRKRFYIKPFFGAVIHRYAELRDLTYKPRNHRLPIHKILSNNAKLRNEVNSLIDEILIRVSDFEGLY